MGNVELKYFCTFTLLLTACFVNPKYSLANEIDSVSGSYFCTGDAAGGVSFNDVTSNWEGTKFNADVRYILNVELWGEIKENLSNEIRNAYRISFSKHGNDADKALVSNCYTVSNQLRDINPLLSFIPESGDFECKMLGGDLVVNLLNGRFLNSYTWGYVDGVDNNNNTPSIIIGTCSRIN